MRAPAKPARDPGRYVVRREKHGERGVWCAYVRNPVGGFTRNGTHYELVHVSGSLASVWNFIHQHRSIIDRIISLRGWWWI